MKWYRTTAKFPSECTLCVYPIEPGQAIAFQPDPGHKAKTKHVTCPRDKAQELANAQITLRAYGFDGGRRS